MSTENTQRSLIAVVQVLSLTVWFSASAVVPALQTAWGIDATEAVWLTASVQIGFVVGAVTSTALNLPDRLPPHLLMAGCALAAAACTAAFALPAHGLSSGVTLRFATGMFLAGVYPVGMKLMASWSEPRTRARAFGVLLGALTLGSALPHLIGGLGDLPWRGVMLTAAAIATAGAVAVAAVALVRPGPLLAQDGTARPHPRYALNMFTHEGRDWSTWATSATCGSCTPCGRGYRVTSRPATLTGRPRTAARSTSPPSSPWAGQASWAVWPEGRRQTGSADQRPPPLL